MSDTQATPMPKTPVHLWVVGIIALLWNAMGAFDYIMTQTRNEAYLSKFSAEELEFFFSFPMWVEAAWAIAIWGGILGVVLILLRRCLAVPVLLVSLVAMVATTIHNYGFSDGMKYMGDPFSLVFTGLIFLISLALFLYARAMQQRGILR